LTGVSSTVMENAAASRSKGRASGGSSSKVLGGGSSRQVGGDRRDGEGSAAGERPREDQELAAQPGLVRDRAQEGGRRRGSSHLSAGGVEHVLAPGPPQVRLPHPLLMRLTYATASVGHHLRRRARHLQEHQAHHWLSRQAESTMTNDLADFAPRSAPSKWRGRRSTTPTGLWPGNAGELRHWCR
jgi:hypothetical protein